MSLKFKKVEFPKALEKQVLASGGKVGGAFLCNRGKRVISVMHTFDPLPDGLDEHVSICVSDSEQCKFVNPLPFECQEAFKAIGLSISEFYKSVLGEKATHFYRKDKA